MKQKVYLGKDSVRELVPILKKHNAKQVFIVRGKGSYAACGAEDIIKKALSEIGCAFTEFYGFSENPKFEDMELGIELLKNSRADMIIAVGGGSVLDMAKLIRFFNSYQGNVTGKYFEKVTELLPLIAIPTTAGTGAEATHFAVVYKDKIKYSAEHIDMLPNYAIIYPPFTYGNPKYLTACTGFDALAQAIEAFWNLNATDDSDKYAERAIKLLWPYLPDLVNRPTEELRDKVSEGSYWAGRAIDITKTTAPHAFSYPFTSYYGYPHGHAVALTFPFLFQLNCGERANNKRISRLMALIGFCDNDNLYALMYKYISSMGLQPIDDIKVDASLIMQNINLDRLKNNPIAIDNLIINSMFLTLGLE